MEKAHFGSRCDECEKQKHDMLICLVCVETLCKDCDRKVHNKGTRVNHRRYQSQRVFYEDYKRELRFRILYFSPECYRAGVLHRREPQLARQVAQKAFEVVSRNTRQGFPMTRMEDLLGELCKHFRDATERIEATLEKVLKAEKLFTFTTRKFGEAQEEKYLSLSLSCISVEALSWILLSIRNDKMQPSHNLIHSRIKEYFDIKINQKDWKKFVENLNERLISKMNRFTVEIPEISVKRVEDDLVLFFFAREGEWDYEDLSAVADDDADYVAFLRYIDDFFSEPAPDTPRPPETRTPTRVRGHHRNKQYRLSDSNRRYAQIHERPKTLSQPELAGEHRPQSAQRHHLKNNLYSPNRDADPGSYEGGSQGGRKDSWSSSKSRPGKKMWLSSVKKPLDKSRSINSQNELNTEKMLASKGHSRAIPGGKYGCALMTKRCGPELLRRKSLGRILALIKRSLDQGVLNHWKTLLVKNNSKPNINSLVREQEIYEHSRNIIELLREHRDGVSLAQFKQYYKNKFPTKPFDYEALQFTKLTDFLNTMEEFVVIEKLHRNNNVAFLKKGVNYRTALNHYTNLLKSVRPSKKKYTQPAQEYGVSMDIICNRQVNNRMLLGHEMNIYQPLASPKPQFSAHVSGGVHLEPTDNIYKSYTLRPQTDNLRNDQYHATLRHKKVISFDSMNYRKRIRNTIIKLLNEHQQGILVEGLLNKLYQLNKVQVRNELLGVNKFEDFLLREMGEDCNVRIIANPLAPGGNYRYVVYPKHEMRTSFAPLMPSWNVYGGYPNSPLPTGTPTTHDNSWLGSSNFKNMLEKNPSLTHNPRKGNCVSGAKKPVNKPRQPSHSDKNPIRTVSCLSGISRVDKHDDLSMGSYGFNQDFGFLRDPKSSQSKSDKKQRASGESRSSKKELSGFNFSVFIESTMEHKDDVEDLGGFDGLRVRSHKSSDEDHPRNLLEDQDLFGDINPQRVKKKQIRLSKSSNKMQKRKTELLNFLGI